LADDVAKSANLAVERRAVLCRIQGAFAEYCINIRKLDMSRIRNLVIVLTFAALVMGADEPTASIYSDKYIAREGLTNFFVKAETGQEVRVAYFGGSITAQAGYHVQTIDWLRNTWADARFVEINAAIGGTGSELGAFRLAKDVLAFKPDLVFI